MSIARCDALEGAPPLERNGLNLMTTASFLLCVLVTTHVANAPPLHQDSPSESSSHPEVVPNMVTQSNAPRESNSPLQVRLFGEIASTGANSNAVQSGKHQLLPITNVTDGFCVDPDVDRDGQTITYASATSDQPSDIFTQNLASGLVNRITTDHSDDIMPTFNFDGSAIAFASDRSGNWDVYTVSLESRKTTQMTTDTANELHPSFSPDGTRLAYCKFGLHSKQWEVWVLNVNAPHEQAFIDYGLYPEFSPDPSRPQILFQRAVQPNSRRFSIWTVEVQTGKPGTPVEVVSAANAGLFNPTWSPDGMHIIFSAAIVPDDEPEPVLAESEVWLVKSDGTGRERLLGDDFANYQPIWSRKGTIFLVSNRSGEDNIWSLQHKPIGARPITPDIKKSPVVSPKVTGVQP